VGFGLLPLPSLRRREQSCALLSRSSFFKPSGAAREMPATTTARLGFTAELGVFCAQLEEGCAELRSKLEPSKGEPLQGAKPKLTRCVSACE
jgi:hypothetical protein